MVAEFLTKLADALKGAGFEAKHDGDYLVVAGCRFDAERKHSRNVVKFLGSSFKVTDGEFDVARAIGLLIATLPARLKEKQALVAAKEFRTQLLMAMRGKQAELFQGYKDWYPTDVSGASLSSCAEGIELKLVCRSVEEAMEMLGKLGA